MKRVCCLFLLLLIAFFAFAADEIIVGTSLDYRSPQPFNISKGFSTSISLFTQDEINRIGTIKQLGWQMATVSPNYPISDIYIKQTTATSLQNVPVGSYLQDATYVGSFATVFQGSTSWKNIDIEDFAYTGGNLMVIVVTLCPYGLYGINRYPQFCYTPATSKHASISQNSTQPTGNVISDNKRPNIKFLFPATVPPAQTTLISPLNTVGGVDRYPLFRWNEALGQPTSYKIYIGTDNPPTNLLNGVDVGNVTQYRTSLSYSTLYYWKVVPVNAIGDGVPTVVRQFTTMADNSIHNFPLVEGFEGYNFPPTGWRITDQDADGACWMTTPTYPHSGTKSLITGNYYGSDYLITPPISLTGNQELRFWAMVNNPTYRGYLSVLLSTTSPSPDAFTNVLMPLTPLSCGVYREYVLDLSAYTGPVYIAFYKGRVQNDDWAPHLDDVVIRDLPRLTPIDWANPAAMMNRIYTREFTIKNTRTTSLSVNSIQVQGTGFTLNSNPAPITLIPGAETTFSVSFFSASTGNYTGSAILNTNFGNSTVPLSMNVVNNLVTNYPFYEGFDSLPFPPVNWAVEMVVPGAWNPTWSRAISAGDGYTIPNHDHSYAMAKLNCSDTPSGTQSRLITPPLKISGTIYGAELSFYMSHRSRYPGNIEGVQIQVSLDGISWTNVGPFISSYTVSNNDIFWSEHKIDLSAYDNQNYIYVGFLGTGDDKMNIYVDQVNVHATRFTPVPSVLLSPADQAYHTTQLPTLTWQANTDSPTGYYLFLGTDGNGLTSPTTLMNGIDMGLNTSYTLPQNLAMSTTYYWQVIPYNAIGTASHCPIRSFTTVFNSHYGGGAPFNGGYYFANSSIYAADAPSQPYYNWIDISTTGTDLIAGGMTDDCYRGPFDIGFSFTYFGNVYTQYYVSSNGMICLGTPSSEYAYTSIPNAAEPNAFIAPLWNDMDPTDADIADKHLYTGHDAEGNLVISFVHYPRLYGPGEPAFWITFQTILKTNNVIKFQYKEYGTPIMMYYSSVGIESPDGLKGVQYMLNGSNNLGVQPGLNQVAIAFSTNPGNLYDGPPLVLRPAIPVYPVANATDIALAPELSWQADQGIYPKGYTLYLGTDGNGTTTPTNLVNGVDLGMDTNFRLPYPFNYGTRYYWQIIPYTLTAEAENCPIWTFTTQYNSHYGGGSAINGGYFYANSSSDAVTAPSQPSYSWTDISTTGIDVINEPGFTDDSYIGPFDIGYDFTFFGNVYTDFYISSNGHLSLGSPSSAYNNESIPSENSPNNIIAPFWDDMNPADPGVTDKHLYLGYDAEGSRVISFVKYPAYNSSSDPNCWITMQVILHKNHVIKFQYKDYGAMLPLENCTIGIENADGTAGVKYLFNGDNNNQWNPGFNEIAVSFSTNATNMAEILPPPTPFNLQISLSSDGITTLTWDCNGDYTSFNIYADNAATGAFTDLIGTTTAKIFEEYALPSNRLYKVTAVNEIVPALRGKTLRATKPAATGKK